MSGGEPSALDYQGAMQDWSEVLGDPELRGAVPDMDPVWGTPKPFSGNFALTFPMTLAGGVRVAVRCFLRGSGTLEQRYRAISAAIAGLPSGVRGHFVGVGYQAQGIRVRGRWWPVVRMEWAGGVTLGEFLEAHWREPVWMRRLAGEVRRLARLLEGNRVAHGDIAPGNVMVEDGTGGPVLRLIDYDGMWVPALAGVGSAERGQVNFQHPGRAGQWGPGLDRFGFISLYVALGALAAEPGLWEETGSGPESVVFQRADHTGEVTGVLGRLCGQGFADAAVRGQARQFASVCRGNFEDIPTLEEFLVRPPAAWPPTGARAGTASSVGASRPVSTELVPASRPSPVRERVPLTVASFGARLAKLERHFGLARAGVPSWTVIAGARGTSAVKFSKPWGIAVDGNGTVWVADHGNHRIQAMGNDGQWRVAGGKPRGGAGARGSGAGEFCSPTGIAVGADGTVWVADSWNHRIQAVGNDGQWWVAGGKPRGGAGARGARAGEFGYPTGIAVDGSGGVWVADAENHRVQTMGRDGQWRVVGGNPRGGDGAIGTGAGEFNNPFGIAVDGNGTVWVADAGNHRIQSKGRDGQWRVVGGNPRGGDGARGTDAGEFSSPSGITVGADGTVWVADAGNHRIQSMGRDGQWRVAGGKPGGGDGARGTDVGEFSSPFGITVDGNGRVWVADSYSHRIQRCGVP